VIIPPTGNEMISMLKNTSLVIVIGSVFDLLFEASQIYAANYKTIPLLIVASIWYLIVTTVLTMIQSRIERRYSRGSRRNDPDSPWLRLWRNLTRFHASPPSDAALSDTGGIR
jgi:polar amino acid transport system permease protein